MLLCFFHLLEFYQLVSYCELDMLQVNFSLAVIVSICYLLWCCEVWKSNPFCSYCLCFFHCCREVMGIMLLLFLTFLCCWSSYCFRNLELCFYWKWMEEWCTYMTCELCFWQDGVHIWAVKVTLYATFTAHAYMWMIVLMLKDEKL